MNLVDANGISEAPELQECRDNEALPGSGIITGRCWPGVAELIERFGSENAALLARPDKPPAATDKWHRSNHANEDAAIGYTKPVLHRYRAQVKAA